MKLRKLVLLIVCLIFSGFVYKWGIDTKYGLLVKIPHFTVATAFLVVGLSIMFVKIKKRSKAEKMEQFGEIRKKGILSFIGKYGFLYFSLPVNAISAALQTEKLIYQSIATYLLSSMLTFVISGLLMGWILWMFQEGDYEEYLREKKELRDWDM